MKSLKILIKLNKAKLDKILLELKMHEEAKSSLERKMAELETEIERETKIFFASDFSFSLETYLLQARKKLQALSEERESKQSAILQLQAQLATQFAEVKQYEIALERKIKQEKIKAQKLEDKMLDEFAFTSQKLT